MCFVVYFLKWIQFSSVQFSRPVVFDSLRTHELQHARPPCPSTTPKVHLNSCPSSQWCHPAISSSVIPFSSCPQSLPASGSFLVSQLFTSHGQSIGVSALASVLPMSTQDWSPLGWSGWISLQSKGLSRVFSNTTVQKHQFFGAQLSSKRIEQFLLLPVTLYSLVAQMVKRPLAMQETWVFSLDQEDPLENGRATHSNILAWEIPWTEEPSSLQSMWSQRVWHNWAINTHTHTHTHITLYYC